ncbi:mycofactocin-coupled SDR family oxidoreductase [Trujillonella humicola]|uniref:mycofactocin-coupled SDR family oxidoreductase n=1 Tax=Trujillonella humicola TaxID=3383699 RepID=UPI003906C986
MTTDRGPGRVAGKVAFITGAGRGQGRSHAVRLAEEGAAVIAVDICAPVDSIPYPLATEADLAETVRAVEAVGGRILARVADVRDGAAMRQALDDGLDSFGQLDIVLANAGVAPVGPDITPGERTWQDVLDINLTGVWRTVKLTAPQLIDQGEGGAIVVTSSAAGLKPLGTDFAGTEGYVAAKHALVGLMRNFATWLAPHEIRVNSVHPSGVATPMIDNDAMRAFLSNTTAAVAEAMSNLMPGGPLDPREISDAVLWLVSDEARHVTGVALPVDGGFAIK